MWNLLLGDPFGVVERVRKYLILHSPTTRLTSRPQRSPNPKSHLCFDPLDVKTNKMLSSGQRIRPPIPCTQLVSHDLNENEERLNLNISRTKTEVKLDPGESQSKHGIKMVDPEPCKELRSRIPAATVSMVGIVPYHPSTRIGFEQVPQALLHPNQRDRLPVPFPLGRVARLRRARGARRWRGPRCRCCPKPSRGWPRLARLGAWAVQ